uniref:Uncharacterized protein n=1 Tax=viral metagenome TaxID=1070528 RepID=A0A6M3K4X7_9ZZZZ
MDKLSARLEIVGELKKLSVTKNDVIVVSFKDMKLYRRLYGTDDTKGRPLITVLKENIRLALGFDVGIIILPPGIELGVIEKKEIAPWVAYTEMTGETGLEGKPQ